VAAVAFVSLTAGLVAALWQAQIAERRFDDLHGLAQVMMGDIYDSVADLPGATTARELITNEAQHYLDRLAQDAQGDLQLGVDLALAFKRIADVQGLPSNANLGRTDAALDNYDKALKIAESLAVADPAVMRAKAGILEKLAEVLAWRGDLAKGLTSLRASHAIYVELQQTQPRQSANFLQLAYSHVKLGDMLGHPSFPNAGSPLNAQAEYRKALLVLEPVVLGAESAWDIRRSYALIHERMGTMELNLGDVDAALMHYNSSRKMRAALAEERPQHTDIYRDFGISVEKIADVQLSRGQLSEALANYTRALGVYEYLVAADPANANGQRTLAIGLENLAEAERVAQQFELALEHYNEALAIRRKLVQADSSSPKLRDELERAEIAAREVRELQN
jgi:tetratricopeptide (TPR) repeat protein